MLLPSFQFLWEVQKREKEKGVQEQRHEEEEGWEGKKGGRAMTH